MTAPSPLPDGREVIIEEIPLEEIRVRVLPDGRMDTPNAAKYLGVSRKTLTNWRCQGKGPSPRYIGSRVFYLRKELDQFIRRRTKRREAR